MKDYMILTLIQKYSSKFFNFLEVLILLPLALFCQCANAPKNQGSSLILRETLIENRNIANHSNKLDILFVLNTLDPGWYPVNFNIKQRFESFVPNMDVSSLDWRMFFINSHYSEGSEENSKAMGLDTQNPQDVQFLDRSIPDYSNVFVDMVTKGLRGENKEGTPYQCSSTGHSVFNCNYGHPLKALKASFASNEHLTRKEATFLVIIISNRDEKGQGITGGEVIDEFKKVYGFDKKFFVWALIIPPNHTGCLNSPEHIYGNRKYNVPKKHLGDYGFQIDELVRLTGGVKYNICRDPGEDYSDLARQIREFIIYKDKTNQI